MVFSSEDKAIIKNDFVEKRWSSYRICQEHPSKNWGRVFVCFEAIWKRLFHGSAARIDGQDLAVTTEENEELVGDLICLQKENPGTDLSLLKLNVSEKNGKSSLKD